MKKTVVKTHYGLGDPDYRPGYPNAKIKKSMGCVVPAWPVRRLATIYHCSECTSIKKEIKAKTDSIRRKQ